MTMTFAASNHPLSQAHAKKIMRRGTRTFKSLLPIWGVSWNLRGRSLYNLGSASMMAMSYHLDPTASNKRMIELLCVSAQSDPATGSINYSDIRMAHDFSRNPYPGAKKRVLDPRDEGTSGRGRPNASWVRLGLEVDRMACRALEQNWQLPVVPQLPAFFAGFPSMNSLSVELTPALLRDIAAHMEQPLAEVEKLDPTTLMALARAHWPSLWRAPDVGGNDTGLWLINAAYTTRICQSHKLFEDFTGMMGVEVWNPARDILGTHIPNPVRECAVEQGIDLDLALQVVTAGEDEAAVTVSEVRDPVYNAYNEQAEIHAAALQTMSPTRFTCSYDEAVDTLFFLRNCIRGSLGIQSRKFTDAELNFAVMNPDAPLLLQVTDPLKDLGLAGAVKAARQQLRQHRPLVDIGSTDDDLADALANPQAPMYASRMCNVQIMRRDVQVPPEHAFHFTPAMLGRDRVSASLWAGPAWKPYVVKGEPGRVTQFENSAS